MGPGKILLPAIEALMSSRALQQAGKRWGPERTRIERLACGHHSFSAELGMGTTFCKVPKGRVSASPVDFIDSEP